jgi:adenylate cyclase, class 2
MISGKKEIEVKILGIERSAIEKKLIALGAVKIFDDEITAFYYDFPDKSIRRRAETLRLREEGMKSVLTLKKDFGSTAAKIREEHEVEVSDFEKMKYLLENIGLRTWAEMKKHRTSYELGEVHFEIDTYQDALGYIPVFLEIEGSDIDTVYAYAELLGFSKDDCRPWDIIQVSAYYSAGGSDR